MFLIHNVAIQFKTARLSVHTYICFELSINVNLVELTKLRRFYHQN